jgi:endonuclease/exonuclease/phosphatase family metal-dependent hydrolase
MLRHSRVLALLATLALGACGSEAPGEAQSSTALAGSRWGKAPPDHSNAGANKYEVKVMTRNLYVGADVNVLIGKIAAALSDPTLTPEQVQQAIAVAVTEFWDFVQTTDFPARARVIADEIEATEPDLIGLQELSLYEIGIPRLDPSAPGGFTVDYTTAIDFLALLQKELTRRGLHYETGPVVENFSGALPDTTGVFIRLTDRDGILVRKGIPTANPRKGNYEAALPLPAPLPPVSRGWTMTDAKIHGRWFTFFETHLEEELTPEVQVPQAQELVARLSQEKLPLIASGDFNAGPQIVESLGVPTYTLLTDAFVDTWAVLRPHSPGLTCCFAADLTGGDLSTRIDLMLLQGAVRPILTWRVGLHDFTRPPAPRLHASDHAGVVSIFRLENSKAFEVASQ